MTHAEILTNKLVAIEKNTKAEVTFIGELLWYSIPDVRITRDDLESLFKGAGLDTDLLPKPISKRDAFRRATKVAETKQPLNGSGKVLNLMVREVKQDSKTIIRQLVREVVDSKNVRLEYLPVVTLTYTDSGIETDKLAELNDIEWNALSKVVAAFEVDKDNYNGQHIRNLMADILATTKPVAVRPSGGVYFVPIQYQSTVAALKSFVNGLGFYKHNGGKGPSLYSVPVVNTDEQREMIQESLDEQINTSSESLLVEMRRVVDTQSNITQQRAEGFLNRIKELRAQVAEYEEQLELQATVAQSRLDIVTQQALKLLDKIQS